MGQQKMLPLALLASLDSAQLEALITSFDATLAQLRVRYEAARFEAARYAGQQARAKLARAARTHNRMERQLIVWRLARRGLGNRDIAGRLGISTRTVERALSTIPRRQGDKF